ncbi:hypothetical protein MTO96_048765 [Rhipicephalus appendiculatus]
MTSQASSPLHSEWFQLGCMYRTEISALARKASADCLGPASEHQPRAHSPLLPRDLKKGEGEQSWQPAPPSPTPPYAAASAGSGEPRGRAAFKTRGRSLAYTYSPPLPSLSRSCPFPGSYDVSFSLYCLHLKNVIGNL